MDTLQQHQLTLTRSYERHLRALNRSDKTITGYLESIKQAEAYLAAHGRRLEEARRSDLEEFFAELFASGKKASTVATRYRDLKVFYRWLSEDEEEISRNPMARIKPPIVPEQPTPVVPEDALKRILAACEGKDFTHRRDMAIITLLLDTGVRARELANLTLDDVDLDYEVLRILAKGRRERPVPFGRKSAIVLDRYLRTRARHKEAHLQWLWLGRKGRLTQDGVYQMLERRGADAGVPELHPHMFRHTFAHQWLANGGGETDLMRLAGWKSRAMLARYAPRSPTSAPARPTATYHPPTGSEGSLPATRSFDDHQRRRCPERVFVRCGRICGAGLRSRGALDATQGWLWPGRSVRIS